MRLLTILTTATFLSLTTYGQSSNDKESVKKVILAFQDDFNAGFKSAATYSTNDWIHINPGGGIKKGRDSVLSEVVGVHQTFLKGVTMTMESIDIRFISPGVAIAVAIHKVDTFTLPDGTKHENEKNIKTYVVVKRNGKWLLELDQNTVVMGSNTEMNQK
jgi:uncharacterized protein (TIGR02246 family)